MQDKDKMTNIADEMVSISNGKGEIIGEMPLKDALIWDEIKRKDEYKKMRTFEKLKFHIIEHFSTVTTIIILIIILIMN